MLAIHRALNTWRTSVARFIALTGFAKAHFVAAGFPAERVTVKPNFADPDPRERVEPGEYALFIGRLVENKGLSVLLTAWEKLGLDYPLHIVGDGQERPALELQARDLGLSAIKFHGQISREKVIETLKGARFTIVPSLWYEAFPMCIVESFACGTPVLCTRLGGMAEIVDDHRNGLHFNPGDPEDLAAKVKWAWTHPVELARMGRAARRKYERYYTAEQNYSVLMQIYAQALENNCFAESSATSKRKTPISTLLN